MFVCLGLERSLGFPRKKHAPGSCLMPAVARWSSLQWRARRPASNVGSIPAININASKLIKKMRLSSWKLTCWGSELFTFFFWCVWSFQHCSNMCHGQRLVYSPIFCDGHQSIHRDFIYLPADRKDSHIFPWDGWPLIYHVLTKALICSHQRNAPCQAKAWGSAQGVAPTGGHKRRLRWVSNGCCGQ